MAENYNLSIKSDSIGIDNCVGCINEFINHSIDEQ